MAFRMILQISVTDPKIDGEIEALAMKMGGRSAGWTKGRVITEAVRMMAHSLIQKRETEPQEAEDEIV